MRGTIAGHRSSHGLRMAALSVVWITLALSLTDAQVQALAQTTEPASGVSTELAPSSQKTPGTAKAQEASTSRMPPPPAPSPESVPSQSPVAPGKSPSKDTPEATRGTPNEGKDASGGNLKLSDCKDILHDLLALDAATLRKDDPDLRKKFQKKAEARANQVLSQYHRGAALTAEDRAFLFEMIYNFDVGARPVGAPPVQDRVTGAAAPTATPPEPAEPTPISAAAPVGLAGPSGKPGESQFQQFAPDDPQFAPIKGVLFAELEKKLTDFGSTLDPGSGSADIRQKLEGQMTSMLTSFIPAPLFFLKKPAEALLKGVVESLVTKIASGQRPQSLSEGKQTSSEGKETITPPTEPGVAMPKRPGNSKIPDDLDGDLRQAAVNTKRVAVMKDPKTSPDDLKKLLRTKLDGMLKLEGLTPLSGLDDAYITSLVAAVASPGSTIKPILDDLEKQLDQFNLDVLGRGIAVRTDRQAEILKLITAWLKDNKQINFDQLPPGDSESILDLIAKVTRKSPDNVTSAGGGAGGTITLPGNLTFPNLGSAIAVPLIMRPGCHLFNRSSLRAGSGTTVIIGR
jgi:hypothetical protein